MEEKQKIFWAVLGLVLVVVVAGAAWWASQGAVAPAPTTGALTTPVTADDWRKGAASSTITIVEYSDFECPACALYYPLLSQLVSDFPEQVAVVYRHFPLPQHRSAKLSAHFAEAAGRQGKFWEMHNLLFDNQATWTKNSAVANEALFKTYAKQIGLDLVRLEADLADAGLAAAVEADYQSGERSGVNSTPSLFINGQKIKNPGNYEVLKQLVTNEL